MIETSYNCDCSNAKCERQQCPKCCYCGATRVAAKPVLDEAAKIESLETAGNALAEVVEQLLLVLVRRPIILADEEDRRGEIEGRLQTWRRVCGAVQQ